nr:unnamed protein product [Digitaria exilis]
MYGNDNWINSYLDAILDAGKGAAGAGAGAARGRGGGGGSGFGERPSLLLRERGHFSPARYFVEEVITGYDETDLYKTWLRANAMRSPQEKNTRLENMTWRIWNLARKKKEFEKEEASRLSKRRLETEKQRNDATADMSEDLFEGVKGEDAGDPSVAYGDSTNGNTPKISSFDKLYIVLISLHGLIRGENMELGRDSDTGGQIMRFFTNPRKPMILAIARPYAEKNITTLVKAFGECRPLRELANLTLIMGNREAISKMNKVSAAVLTSVLTLIDEYDLYGQVAYPKHHKHSEVPDIYRLAARTKGAFVNVAYFEQFGVTLIEAAMHGLPVIATKNGAPVEIHQVLDNGLLVDPHDQHSIADALYKMLSEKQFWSRCRENGLKNIHQFSWPEHCKNYVSRILTLGPRHPAFGNREDHKVPVNCRKHILVIAVDSVSKEDLIQIIRNSIEATRTGTLSGSTGFVLSTSLTIAEIRSLIKCIGMLPTDFDAFICNSGSDIYYPSKSSDVPSTIFTFALDNNYRSHIEYRWGGEGLRKYLVKWASSVVERRGRTEKQIIFEDSEHSSTYCLAFRVANPNHLPPLKELQKLMRIQSLRCHALYNHGATRYLSIRWGIELPDAVVIVGETGDSDYEELFGGLHKTIILKGGFNTPANRIHTVRRYPLQDVVALDSSNIIGIEGFSSGDIRSAMQQLGIPAQ